MHFSMRLLSEQVETPLAGNLIYMYGMLFFMIPPNYYLKES